jgi:hypothetical protein
MEERRDAFLVLLLAAGLAILGVVTRLRSSWTARS